MKHLVLLPVILLSPPAWSQQDEPSWEAKKAALMQVFLPPVPLPVARPDVKNEIDEQADLNMSDLRKFARRANYKMDICARHHMRKVITRGGNSWRCK
jgi:hypothetical protein